jgi:hypothetical protein
MAPPSVHESGSQYRWLSTSRGKAQPVPLTLEGLRKKPRAIGQNGNRTIRVGERNEIPFKVACSLRRRIGDEDTILEMMKAANERVCDEPLNDKELRSITSSSGRYVEPKDELFGPIHETKPLPMEWVWYPYIPRYGVTILAGDPGKGKSLLTSLLIGVVSSGACWPLSNEKCLGRRVLILSAEDNWQRVTPRAHP